MRSEVLNLEAPEARQRITEWRKSLSEDPVAEVRTVASREKGVWRNVVTIVRATPSAAPKVASLDYGDVVLAADAWGLPELLRFPELIVAGEFNVDGIDIQVGDENSRFWSCRLVSSGQFDTRPGVTLSFAGPSAMPNGLNEPLVKYGRPFFKSAGDAAAEWCSLDGFPSSSRVNPQGVVLFLGDRGERFSRIGAGEDEDVVFEIAHAADPLKVVGVWGRGAESTTFEVDVAEGRANVPIPVEADGMTAYLVGKERVHDWHREAFEYSEGHAAVLPGRAVRAVSKLEEAIAGGETETTEFKPYIAPGEAKLTEIMETVIAFANTKGGRVVLGVSDRCEIEGVMKGLKKEAANKGRASALEEYIGRLRQTLNGQIEPVAEFDIKAVEIADRTLVVVEVPRGSRRPYSTRFGDEIFIRRGASNARPNPRTELPDLIRGSWDSGFPR